MKLIKNLFREILKMAKLIQLIINCIIRKNVFVHIGFPYEQKIMTYNVGDPILYYELEQLWNYISKDKYTINWVHVSIDCNINKFLVFIFNKFAKAIVVGGHGLIMEDCGCKQSGWLFNISINNLQKIKTPLIFFAIGYNTFRSKVQMPHIFTSHINNSVDKSSFFSLRNYGSIRSVKRYLNLNIQNKLIFQPCPTTMLMYYKSLPIIRAHKDIGICLAFDRFCSRFHIEFNTIYYQLELYKLKCKELGYNIVYFVHEGSDLNNIYCKEIIAKGVHIESLAGNSIDDIYKFYLSKTLIVGMRGHSLMIPFGLNIPIISLTNQDKQLFFMETTPYPEFSIEVDSEDFINELYDKTTYIINNYEQIKCSLKQRSLEFFDITKHNIDNINNIIF